MGTGNIDNTDNTDNMYIPEKDEFCWFISVNDSYELLQFVGFLENTKRYMAKTIHGGIYNYSMCEKFTGELPEHLKNILKQKKDKK